MRLAPLLAAILGLLVLSNQAVFSQIAPPETIAIESDARGVSNVRCHVKYVQRLARQKNIQRPDCESAFSVKGFVNTTDVVYNNGPVVKTGREYLLYLNQPSNTWGNPRQFLDDLDGSYFVNIVNQYINSISVAKFGVSDEVNLSSNTPHVMMLSDIQAAILSSVHHFYRGGGGGGYDKIYNLFLPPGQDTCLDRANCYSPDNQSTMTFCAYHLSFDGQDIHGLTIHVLFTVIPYQNTPECAYNAGPNGPLVDSNNMAWAHETFETITDPDPHTGWVQNDGLSEIGDICIADIANPIILYSHSYAIQKIYSNLDHACVSVVKPTLVAPKAEFPPELFCDGFEMRWSAVSGASDYRIDVSSDSTFATIGSNNVDAGSSTAVFASAFPITEYYYRVRAFSDTGGTSSDSNVIGFMTLPASSPTCHLDRSTREKIPK
jgi:hypothetical protein